jgi:hypothetical protein
MVATTKIPRALPSCEDVGLMVLLTSVQTQEIRGVTSLRFWYVDFPNSASQITWQETYGVPAALNTAFCYYTDAGQKPHVSFPDIWISFTGLVKYFKQLGLCDT